MLPEDVLVDNGCELVCSGATWASAGIGNPDELLDPMLPICKWSSGVMNFGPDSAISRKSSDAMKPKLAVVVKFAEPLVVIRSASWLALSSLPFKLSTLPTTSSSRAFTGSKVMPLLLVAGSASYSGF